MSNKTSMGRVTKVSGMSNKREWDEQQTSVGRATKVHPIWIIFNNCYFVYLQKLCLVELK